MENDFKHLLVPAVQQFIIEHQNDDITRLLLRNKTFHGVSAAEIAQQIAGRKKAKEKLPTWYNTANVIFPPTINLEQASSEATAIFKAEFVASLSCKQQSFVDLTSGFGVDSFFLGKIFHTSTVVEPHKMLLQMARHNQALFGGATPFEYKNSEAEYFLQTSALSEIDLFYIDPSRRKETQKVYRLADCTPDITFLQSKLLKQGLFIFTKASPLLDIQQGLRELQHVEKVIVLALDNEVKELLFLQTSGFIGEPEITAVNITSVAKIISSFNFKFSQERPLNMPVSSLQNFLYEPNAAILKSGAFKLVAHRFGLSKIHANTHLYTSAKRLSDFPGRVFYIEAVQPTTQQLNVLLQQGKANIITRNYPLTPEQLKKKMKLKDGGEKYVIAFSEESRKTIAVATRIQ
ncbi:MAG: THUMP-like domain-containing protein [Flammeovirgaceae bacterium]